MRLHRYLLDRNRVGRVVIEPRPVAWTEAPEVYRDLGKQRGRWYRGLLEVLNYHRAMLFRRRYGRIGMFSLPYQLLFEAAAPVIEVLGYVLVPLSALLGLLSIGHAFGFLMLATAANIMLSTAALIISVRPDGMTISITRGCLRIPASATRSCCSAACAMLSRTSATGSIFYTGSSGVCATSQRGRKRLGQVRAQGFRQAPRPDDGERMHLDRRR